MVAAGCSLCYEHQALFAAAAAAVDVGVAAADNQDLISQPSPGFVPQHSLELAGKMAGFAVYFPADWGLATF